MESPIVLDGLVLAALVADEEVVEVLPDGLVEWQVHVGWTICRRHVLQLRSERREHSDRLWPVLCVDASEAALRFVGSLGVSRHAELPSALNDLPDRSRALRRSWPLRGRLGAGASQVLDANAGSYVNAREHARSAGELTVLEHPGHLVGGHHLPLVPEAPGSGVGTRRTQPQVMFAGTVDELLEPITRGLSHPGLLGGLPSGSDEGRGRSGAESCRVDRRPPAETSVCGIAYAMRVRNRVRERVRAVPTAGRVRDLGECRSDLCKEILVTGPSMKCAPWDLNPEPAD